MYQNSNEYYDDLGLGQYGFSTEEKDQICSFYDHSKTNSHDIYPITKEEFDDMKSWSEKYLPEVCLLWSNRNGNFAGVYRSVSLIGKICIVDHEEEMYAPLFRSIDSFIAAVVVDKITDLYNEDMLRRTCADYPSLDASQAEKDSDLEIAQFFIK